MPLARRRPRKALGIDISQHGEEAYASGEGAMLDPARTPGVLRVARHRPRRGGWEESIMKLIVAIIRPDRLNAVLEALYRADVRGLTISRVQGHGGELRGRDVPRHDSEDGAVEKVRLEIGVSDHFVEPTVRAILTARPPATVGDGKISSCRSRRCTGSARGRRTGRGHARSACPRVRERDARAWAGWRAYTWRAARGGGDDVFVKSDT